MDLKMKFDVYIWITRTCKYRWKQNIFQYIFGKYMLGLPIKKYKEGGDNN